jgi:hypothetical protein
MAHLIGDTCERRGLRLRSAQLMAPMQEAHARHERGCDHTIRDISANT